ncbi:hypothetical protein V8C34DRAFT_282187 [Trichoderma compactum]
MPLSGDLGDRDMGRSGSRTSLSGFVQLGLILFVCLGGCFFLPPSLLIEGCEHIQRNAVKRARLTGLRRLSSGMLPLRIIFLSLVTIGDLVLHRDK